MKARTLILLGVPALLFGGTMVGCSNAGHSGVASAASAPDAGLAAKQADRARKAIADRDGAGAVRFAEAAVAASPRDATYRALLGQAYLAAGRFQSAAQAYADTLTLDPANGRAALNLALAQTATGDWVAARKTLADHVDQIGAADRGLALALAGDPDGAIQLLSVAARDPSANATVRQNFALALALGGHWQEARAVAAVDVPADQIDARLAQWAAFARPTAASDQVAALLGVTPAADQGQPVQLALVAPAPVAAPPAAIVADKGDVGAADVNSVLAGSAGDVASGKADDLVTGGADVAQLGGGTGVTFAPPSEVVQRLPAPVAKLTLNDVAVTKGAPKPGKGVVAKASAVDAPAFSPNKGGFFVQLGAYDNAAVAQDAWRRMTAHTPRLSGLAPTGMSVTVGGKSYYRLSVGGYARGDADKICGAVKSSGGRCFVRADAGDTKAAWVKGASRVAGR